MPEITSSSVRVVGVIPPLILSVANMLSIILRIQRIPISGGMTQREIMTLGIITTSGALLLKNQKGTDG